MLFLKNNMSNELGKFLKTRIINAGMSQKDFAQQLDLSPTALSQIITGKVKPRQATISKIMKLLNLSREEEQTLIKTFENYSSLPEDKSAPKTLFACIRKTANAHSSI